MMPLLDDVRKVLEGFDQKIFIRDISGDHRSDWAVTVMPYLAAVGRLKAWADDQEGER